MNIANKLRNLALTSLVTAGLLGAVEWATGCVYLPTVWITGSDTNASEVGSDTGMFTVWRDGCPSSSALTVYYEISGTASLNGDDADYELDPLHSTPTNYYVTIPAGACSNNIIVTPILDTDCGEGTETVVLTLVTNAAYWLGSPTNATVYIADMPGDTDSDGDGLPDVWELLHFGNLDQTGSGDYDGDGLTNLQEYQQGSNPVSQDSDGDGVIDQPFKIIITQPGINSQLP